MTDPDQPLDYVERPRFVRMPPLELRKRARAKDLELNRRKDRICGLGEIMMIVAGLVAGLIFIGLMVYLGAAR